MWREDPICNIKGNFLTITVCPLQSSVVPRWCQRTSKGTHVYWNTVGSSISQNCHLKFILRGPVNSEQNREPAVALTWLWSCLHAIPREWGTIPNRTASLRPLLELAGHPGWLGQVGQVWTAVQVLRLSISQPVERWAAGLSFKMGSWQQGGKSTFTGYFTR